MTITATANTTNINFQDNVRNLLITNDLTTGNILFTSERHNITPQVLGTLVAEADVSSTDEAPRIRIKRMNDDGTVDRVIIRRKLVWRFFCQVDGTQEPSRISTDADGPTQLAAVLDYLNNLFTEIPATTSTILKFGPDDTLDAARDATNTTVLFDNGKEHAVNAIQAIENSVGLIDVVDHATQQVHFQDIRFDKVTIVGNPAGNNNLSVINALNALFTVNPLGAGYQPTTILPTVAGEDITYNQAEETIPSTDDPITGEGHLQVATGNDPHGSRLWSNEMIDEAGEYFDFKVTGKGQFLLGFYELGVDEPNLAEGTTGNQHTGMYWSLSLYNYGSYMGPHTIYGRGPGLSYGPGWNGAQSSRYATNQELQDNHNNGYANLWRAGIDSNGYLYIAYFDAGRTNDYIMVARRSSLHNGTQQFGFACKLINGNATLVDVPVRTATDPGAPALAYRYIESPDGQFYYPLFASADEAAYVDVQNGGAEPGSAHAHTFVDEPTGTIWYMPDNGGTHAGPSAPSNTSEITYTVIPTEDDGLHVPPAFSQLAGVVAPEGTAVNINLYTSGDYVTSLNPANPFGLVINNGYLQGNLPYVSEDVTNIVTVTRTNAFGSSTGQFALTTEDRPELSAIAGWTVHQGNTVSPDIIKPTEGAVLEYNTLLSPGTRVRIPFQQYMKFGIPNSTGIGGRETVELFNITTDHNYFDLLFTVHTNGSAAIVNGYGEGVGWVDNTSNTQATHTNSDVYFLEYRTDNKFYLINNDTGEVLGESADTYGADVPLYYGIPVAYTSDKTIPSITLEDISFTGGAISGFTKDNTGENLIDASTLGDGSVVTLDEAVANNHRLVIRKEWIETHVMPGLQNATGTSQFFIGIPEDGADFGSTGSGNGPVAAEDFKLAVGIAVTDSIRGTSFKTKMYKNGAQVHDIGVGGTGLTNTIYDIVFSNVDGRLEMSLQNNFGTPVPGDASTEQRLQNGGNWSQTVVNDPAFVSGPQTIYFGTQNLQATLSLTGLEHHREPFLVRDILVGEYSNGHTRFALQPSATKFDNAPNGHAWSGADWAHPTLEAGQTYRYIFHPSLEADDDIMIVRAADGVAYGTLTPFGSGDPSFTSDYKGYTFTVPTDAPPLEIAYKNGNGGNTAFGNYKELPVSGSTYSVSVTGITDLGPNSSGSVLTDSSWVELTETLSAGERLVLNSDFLLEVAAEMPSYDRVYFGLKAPGWTNAADADNGFLGDVRFFVNKVMGGMTIYMQAGSSSGSVYLDSDTGVMLEITHSGNNVRTGVAHPIGVAPAPDAATTAYADWSFNLPAYQTGDQGYGISDIEVVVYYKRADFNSGSFDTANVDWTKLFEVAVPAPAPANQTPWTKALDFDGSAERAQQVNQSSNYNPVMMGAYSQTVAQPAAGKTATGVYAYPWATAIVFKPSGHNSNQHIWNVGEGQGSGNDNIYVRVDATGGLYFGWGRDGALNECYIGSTFWQQQFDEWIGLYIGFNGARFSAGDATPANLMNAFDIRMFGESTTYYNGNPGVWSAGNNISNQWGSNLSTTGARMDRQLTGHTTIGGRGANRSFHGKIASFVVTTLKQDDDMPSTAEITKMVTDPRGWLQDYKVGETYRRSYEAGNPFTFALNDQNSAYSTQVWLMGDGPNDAFAQIRNDVNPTYQNIYPLNMLSMVANDIETVNIPGLS